MAFGRVALIGDAAFAARPHAAAGTAKAAEDAFMGFLYYSPFSYAYSTKVSGFQVYPTGNYHLEDVTLGS